MSWPTWPSAAKLARAMLEPPAVDASPIIILAQGGQFDLLRAIAERIIIPTRVAAEIRRPFVPDATTLALDETPWLEIVDTGPVPPAIHRFRLTTPVIGTLGMILEAKRAGLIPAARPIVTHLLQVTDWFLSPDIVAQALELVGE